MVIKLTANLNNPPISGLATALLIGKTHPVEVVWAQETSVVLSNGSKLACHSNNDVLRALAREAPQYKLYGKTAMERTQIDHWLSFSLTCGDDISYAMEFLNKSIAPITFLVSNKLTIADLALFNEIHSQYEVLAAKGIPQHVLRWYNLIQAQEQIQSVLDSLPAGAKVVKGPNRSLSKEKESKPGERKQEGKFVDLPGAEMGKVVVRFPPEASGYLHIGHAKAALLNQYYQQAFQGKLIMRFDDTNPAKENAEFEKVILGDLEMLQIKPDLFTHTSQYFDIMLEYCEQLLKEGKAYADDTDPETMKKEREQKIESANRSNCVEKNFEMWKEMVAGTARGQKCCIRAKIDMNSPNGCMRDPTIYRCKNEEHPRTGTKYKVYPTYDFACPIVDAIENVTHTLRTMEYHDRDDQFYWFIEALKLRRPYIWEYSRLNMTNTVLSKRKLTWFVEQGLVDGWDDPRFPTVRGILRRGMTVEGLKEFIIAQGSSKSVVFMEWDKIWAFNKKVIDPIAPRYTALEYENRVIVNVAGAKKEAIQVAAHPKNDSVGMKTIWLGPRIFIDYADAEALNQGENATFINWGNLLIKKINRSNGKITSIDADLNLDNKDFKKTLKLTWLCEVDEFDYPPTYCVYFEHIVSKPILGKDEDFKQYVTHNTRTEVKMLGDPELKKCKQGDIIQLQRRGFFRVDTAYEPPSLQTGVICPVVLFAIPDGHSKEMPTSGAKKQPVTEVAEKKPVSAAQSSDIDAKIQAQGEVVRTLKSQNAPKQTVEAEVKVLLSLKADYKTATGKEWKPTAVTANKTQATIPSAAADHNASDLDAKIKAQGDLVRDLKAQKAAKDQIDASVKALLALKADYKVKTGQDWKPGAITATPSAKPSLTGDKKVEEIDDKIKAQGELVRNLKSQKAAKDQIDVAVKTLLSLKADFKAVSGKDWQPNTQPTSAPTTNEALNALSATDLDAKIKAQGEVIRDLKAKKAPKLNIDLEVKNLLSLKASYKSVAGVDWKPDATPPKPAATTASAPAKNSNVEAIDVQIKSQGELVRDLKSKKAPKDKIDSAVKTLLQLKSDYKAASGVDWKPTTTTSASAEKPKASPAPSKTLNMDQTKAELTEKINAQGEIVRDLKSKKASKEDIDAAVKRLLDLKAEYKEVAGTDFPIAGRTPTKPNAKPKSQGDSKKAKPEKKEAAKAKQTDASKEAGAKKVTRLGLEATKEGNLPEWYSQVITKGELIEYYDVSGCYILRHWSYAIWKAIKTWFDNEITKLGVKECYFPIFVSRAALEKEKTHIADFAPEVAWVTKSGESELAEPIAIRPTSETVMYPAFAKWIQSYRDLPIRLNQWNNVVRWEFKHPQPFLRTREFLWQEGHTAYAIQKDAEEEVLNILDLYGLVYTHLLAIPVIKGRKTEKEKFAGGDYTTTVEAFISASGRAIQGATSHHLGQNFSKMFDIVFEDPETQQKQYVYQNSWGITTRTIGVMIMVHADNQGLVLPPHVACVQAIIVPCGITVTMKEEERKELLDCCKSLEKALLGNDIRVEGDYRDNYSPGWKFNHWELKGVPIRIEIGPKDMKNKQIVAVRRDNGGKTTIPMADVEKKISQLLENIHESMLAKATVDLKSHTKITKSWDEFCQLLDAKNIIMTPFCGNEKCEDQIKGDSARDQDIEPGAPAMGAKSLCIPFEQPAKIEASDKCVHPSCSSKAKFYTLFGRSY